MCSQTSPHMILVFLSSMTGAISGYNFGANFYYGNGPHVAVLGRQPWQYSKPQPCYQDFSISGFGVGIHATDFRLLSGHPSKLKPVFPFLDQVRKCYAFRVPAVHQAANAGIIKPGDLTSFVIAVAQGKVSGDAPRGNEGVAQPFSPNPLPVWGCLA